MRVPKRRSTWQNRQRFILDRLAATGKIRPKDVSDEFPVTKTCGRLDIMRLRKKFPGMLEFRYLGRSGYWCLVVQVQRQAA